MQGFPASLARMYALNSFCASLHQSGQVFCFLSISLFCCLQPFSAIFLPLSLLAYSIKCSIEQNARSWPITAFSAGTFLRQSEQRLVLITLVCKKSHQIIHRV